MIRARGFLAFLVILALVRAPDIVDARQDTNGPGVPIESGKTVALGGGQARRYTLSLEAEQAATVVVVHQGIDVTLRAITGEAQPDIELMSDGPAGELRLRIVGNPTRSNTIEIAATYSKNPDATFAVSVEDIRAATAADRQTHTATRHETRARRLRSAASYASALAEAQQALVLRERISPTDEPAIARSLLLVAQLNDALARFGDAEGLYARARRLVEASRPESLLLADVLNSHAAHCIARAQFREAEPFVRESLAIRERVLGPDHVLVAESWGTLSDLHHETANYREAGAAADRALEIAALTYQRPDVSLGAFINRAARGQLALGDFTRAEHMYRESLEVADAKTPPHNLAVAESVGGLARVALQANDNVKAEELHLRTLAIKEKALGPDHPLVASDVFNLALIHYRRRDYTEALALYQRALRTWENTVGESHPRMALGFNNLGLVYWRQSDYKRAEEFFQRAFELSTRLYGGDSLRVTTSLANLGIIAKQTGNYDVAEARYTQALAIQEKHLGPDHPQLITNVESLAILYRDRGDYARAERMFERTLRITESSLGPEHAFVARHLDNVAHLSWATGNWEGAFAAMQRYLAIEERHLPLNMSIGSERQKLAYFEPRLRNLDEAISFHVQHPGDHPGIRDLALTTLLQRKGRILDALADNVNAFRNRARPEDKALLAELTQVTSKFAAAVLGDSTGVVPTERQRLAAERERLEGEIHRRSSGYLARSDPMTLAAVRETVPSDAALVEFAVYRPFNPRSSVEKGNQFGAPRYIAYAVRKIGEPGWKDLGAVEEIDDLVHRFRAALGDPSRSDVTRLARELHQKVLAPVLSFTGDARHLLISPDGALNLIPFEALRGTNGRYVVEEAAVSYLTTGRDLVRMQTPRPSASGTVVFANPAFGEAAPSAEYFAPLAGTATEARRILTLFPDADIRLGARATEHALKSLRAPRVLHVATHGFFLDEDASTQNRGRAKGTRALSATSTAVRVDHPLLRSGLALAGANLSPRGGDDGIVTALEASNLNLWGTKLVTLSACDTGVGVVRNGEGVYGLRRAFFLAGAETLVMSLWPVSDLITRETMSGYYAGLRQGLGRGAALREVRLRMLKRDDRAHPFYWASFIQAGEWASLDGRR